MTTLRALAKGFEVMTSPLPKGSPNNPSPLVIHIHANQSIDLFKVAMHEVMYEGSYKISKAPFCTYHKPKERHIRFEVNLA
jgi:hypothetical protein